LILTVHHQGVCLYLAKVTEYLKIKKNTEFKIPKINSGVVAAIHVADVRGTRIAATTPELIVGILNSVFFNFFIF